LRDNQISDVAPMPAVLAETQATNEFAMTLSKRARLFWQRRPRGSNAPPKRDWNFEALAPRDETFCYVAVTVLAYLRRDWIRNCATSQLKDRFHA
jgi:hypothetical protein